MPYGNILNTRCVELTMTIPTTPTHAPTSAQLSQEFHTVSVSEAFQGEAVCASHRPRSCNGLMFGWREQGWGGEDQAAGIL